MIRFFRFLIIPLFISCQVYSQSLGLDRVEKLKRCTVRLETENKTRIGTGFFVSENGHLATNFHNVNKAIKRDSITNDILSIGNVWAFFDDGRKIRMGIAPHFLYEDDGSFNYDFYKKGIIGDFILLFPAESTIKKFEYLKLGSWEDISEGDEVYTAGYPLGNIDLSFFKGIVSTKFIQTRSMKINGIENIETISAAYLDVTINGGNSGGPLIKYEKKSKKERVVGIIGFRKNPNSSKTLDKALNYIRKYNELNTTDDIKYKKEIDDKKDVFYALSQNSVGIGGAYPINILKNILSKLYQKQ
ncbi:S1 family peptidase [Maribacter cobaltidurans]|uniref:Serine protease n=1 Tax=Maribacter cobaltidurans TaxID=1178778 RepID=A0A223V3Y8_9FLAO|nr:serine protease [Maribacter cobaltidurans]ASV29840.1 hypothetical protein CJ263_06190 [Maribacter cobaltidurans]